ncbi:MAG TPA: glycoside hydrolase family 18 protein [Balneolales bacterium]|nr:glycoside hydrolase family 18 protein [Balneolales bacterium]
MHRIKWIKILSLCLLLAACNDQIIKPIIPKSQTSGNMWVSAYLGAWNHYAPPGGNWGNVHTNEIDWNAFTQLIYFSTTPNNDGSLSPIAPYDTFSPSRLDTIVTAAHKAKKPILFTVGGWGTHPGFSSSIQPANRQTFINNLVGLLKTWKFDGIDLDMEPINSSDVQNYTAFVKALYSALQSIKTPMLNKPMLTAATQWQPSMYANLQDYFDQINLMTYDYSGAWPGWVTWFNSPVYNGGVTFKSNGNPLPSANQTVDEFIKGGVKASKLGIGIDFYGYIWTGVTKPLESWTTAPTVKANVPYYTIINDYPAATAQWDSKAESAYFSINNSSTKQFVSFDNEQSIKAKVDYVRNKKIGGLIIWELGGGFFANNPAGQKDPLLQAVKQDVFH